MTSKKPTMEHEASETHIEIVNHEDDALFSIKKSRTIKKYRKGNPKAISNEGVSTPAQTPPTVNLFISEDDGGKPTQPKTKRRRIGDGEFSNFGISNHKIEHATFVCGICVDDKSANESFGVQNCSHSYCRDCIRKYVASKLQQNISSIGCPVPDCRGSLDPEYCRPILPPEVVERWQSALRESTIDESQRFYCPFKDCSTMLIEDGTQVVTESECPNCKRMFCAQCKVPWHAEIDCEEFQKLNEDEREKEDIMLRNLARKELWSRCPKCKFYVEKTCGCDHIICRCRNQFNYAVGRF